jgi:hypothetical protein
LKNLIISALWYTTLYSRMGWQEIFAVTEEILEKPAADLAALQQKDLQTCFQQGEGCWSKYLCVKGRYLKG